MVVDCRFSLADPEAGRRDYEKAHIPSAVYAHLDDDLAGPVTADNGRHPLPEPAARLSTSTLRGWGISNDTQVVVYDDAGGAIAARLWWMLRWLGHDAVAVLDGGFSRVGSARFTATSSELPNVVSGCFSGRPDATAVMVARARCSARLPRMRQVRARRCPRCGAVSRRGQSPSIPSPVTCRGR